MSNLFKSKFLLGVMVITVLAVGALAFTANTSTAAASACEITSTLRVGSTGAQVSCLQTLVGVTADGHFGPMTKAAVMTWQTSKGLVADGVFGAKSRAVYNVGGEVGESGCPAGALFNPTTGASCTASTVPGCVAGALFSSTTGVSCTGVSTNLPAGCTSASGFSPTTGLSCSGVSTVTSGTNGYLSDIGSDSTGRVSTVYESEQDKIVAGFRTTARLADQTVDRVRVQMRNTDTGGSSANLAKYITGASLWNGSTKIATMTIANADRSVSNDTYTFNFSSLNSKIPKDTIGRFYVSVSANGSLDTTDSQNANWAVTFPDGGVSASSPDGMYDTYSMSAGNVGTLLGSNVGFTFGKFLTNGVKATVNLSTSNPAAGVVGVSNTSATNNVTLLKFTVKATNSDLTLRKVPVTIVATGNNVSTIISNVKLYQGSNIVDSLDSTNGFVLVGGAGTAINPASATAGATTTGYLFSNLSDPYNKVQAGSTVEYSIVADITAQSNFTAGDTIVASLNNSDVLLTANMSIQDVNGDQLTTGSTYRVGSAVGELQTLLVNGVNVVMGTPGYAAVTNNGDTTQVTYTVPVTVTSFGNTLYMGTTITDEDYVTLPAGTEAFAFRMKRSSNGAEAACTLCSTNITSSDASIETTGYRLDSGQAKHFTITVIMVTPAANSDLYAVHLLGINTWTNGALNAGTAKQALVPSQNFTTGYQFITN